MLPLGDGRRLQLAIARVNLTIFIAFQRTDLYHHFKRIVILVVAYYDGLVMVRQTWIILVHDGRDEMVVARLRAGAQDILRVEVLPVPAVLLGGVGLWDDLHRGNWAFNLVRDATLVADALSVADARELRALACDRCGKLARRQRLRITVLADAFAPPDLDRQLVSLRQIVAVDLLLDKGALTAEDILNLICLDTIFHLEALAALVHSVPHLVNEVVPASYRKDALFELVARIISIDHAQLCKRQRVCRAIVHHINRQLVVVDVLPITGDASVKLRQISKHEVKLE